jgi:hypothetical protein
MLEKSDGIHNIVFLLYVRFIETTVSDTRGIVS